MKNRNSCREERVRAFVMFADTTGYTTWAKRSATSPEDKSAYNRQMYNEFFRLERESGLEFKYLCDGFFAAKEMSRGHNCGLALNILRHAWNLQQRMEGLIATMRHPRPEGFRVRVACGMVSKIIIPPTSERDRRVRAEYVGESPILGDRLLEIERGIGCICTVPVRELLKDDAGVIFDPVVVTGTAPKGIDDEDLKELLSFRFAEDGGKVCPIG
jgi:hypothetical protein